MKRDEKNYLFVIKRKSEFLSFGFDKKKSFWLYDEKKDRNFFYFFF